MRIFQSSPHSRSCWQGLWARAERRLSLLLFLPRVSFLFQEIQALECPGTQGYAKVRTDTQEQIVMLHIHVHACVHMCTYACTRVCSHICAGVRTHTQTQTDSIFLRTVLGCFSQLMCPSPVSSQSQKVSEICKMFSVSMNR